MAIQNPVVYGGSGQTQPERIRSYNRTYWSAVEKDINQQNKQAKFPNRRTYPRLEVKPSNSNPTAYVKGLPSEGLGKRTRPQG